MKRRGFNRGRTDCVAADALFDKIRCHGFGESNHGGLTGPVDKTVWDPFDVGSHRSHVDNTSYSGSNHGRKESLDHAEHRTRIEIHGKIPVVLSAFQQSSMMHKTCAIEEHIHGSQFLCQGFDGISVGHIQYPGFNPRF